MELFLPVVVCYAADRNELRSRVIQWLQTEIVPDGWFAKGSNFSEILLKYFKVGFFSLLWCRITECVHTFLKNTTISGVYVGHLKPRRSKKLSQTV